MLSAIVLSGGKGTRMKSDLPKVCHKILDYEMVNHVLLNLSKANINNVHMVVGYQKDVVINKIDKKFPIIFSEQAEQLGTGHAVLQVKGKIQNTKGQVIITFGDTPLIQSETFIELAEYHKEQKNNLTVLTTDMNDSTGYGRIIRNSEGNVDKIVEQKDTSSEEVLVKEINSGVFCVDIEYLIQYIDLIDNNNKQKEYYLTDLVSIFNHEKLKVGALKINDQEQLTGVNDLNALAMSGKIMQLMINKRHLTNGVNIIDPTTTYIGADVKIGKGTIIYPGCVILGNTEIGEDNLIYPNTTIFDSTLGDDNQLGPMAFLRNHVEIKNNCRIGNFVELKNTTFENNSKSAHLAYIGDSSIGENVNIGCGVITANYDGVNKNKTKIDDNSFIGSNVNLIAPLEIGKNSFIAAGTTVTSSVEDNKFVIGRSRTKTKEKR